MKAGEPTPVASFREGAFHEHSPHIAAAVSAFSSPATADGAQTQPTATPCHSSAIEQRLAADGFRVLEIERYPNSVEVKGYDRVGPVR